MKIPVKLILYTGVIGGIFMIPIHYFDYGTTNLFPWLFIINEILFMWIGLKMFKKRNTITGYWTRFKIVFYIFLIINLINFIYSYFIKETIDRTTSDYLIPPLMITLFGILLSALIAYSPAKSNVSQKK
jgi:hypothetical protein